MALMSLSDQLMNRLPPYVRKHIRVKLLSAFLILVTLAALVGILSVRAQNRARVTTQELIAANDIFTTVELDLAGSAAELGRLMQNYALVSADPGRLDEATTLYLEPWRDEIIVARDLLDRLEANQFDPTTIETMRTNLDAQIVAMNGVVGNSEVRIATLNTLFETDLDEKLAPNGLAPHEAHVLQLVQLEKAFVISAQDVFALDLRESAAIEGQFDALASEIRTDIAADDTVSAEARNAFIVELDSYAASFNLLVDAEHARRASMINVEAETAALKQMIEQEVETLRSTVEGQESAIRPLRTAALVTLIPLILLNAFLTLLFGYGLVTGIQNQIERFQHTIHEIDNDNLDARVEIVSEDEIGLTAQEFNTLLDNTTVLIQSREEQERIQQAIMRLLIEVGDVAEGDLSKTLAADDKITGAIAESFNYMIEQLREIIVHVQTTANRVSSSSSRIQSTSATLAEGSGVQSEQIVTTSAAVDEMSVSIQQVSNNSAESAEISQQVRIDAQDGAQAVRHVIGSMQRVRSQIEDVEGSVNDLRAYSEQIGEILTIVRNLADHTAILAINASIEASSAGSSGRGFAVVAREVETLALQTSEATEQVSEIITAIQRDTQQTVAATAATVAEVRRGSQLAGDAGKRLEEIELVTVRLAELMQEISTASRQQAKSSETVAQSMSNISLVTQQTAAGTRQASLSLKNLTTLAERLRASVSTFYLANTQASPANSPHSLD